MALLDMWLVDREAFEQKQVWQVVTISGDGKLRDGNVTSVEFREYLASVPSRILQRYVEECLSSSSTDNGLILQDLINQIGNRLGFQVESGRYRGVKDAVGFDGLWKSSDGYVLVVEVKTTDAYRINLDKVAKYRERLIDSQTITDDQSSILIVVGRKDTGDLEAQVRGSRHAWDVRLISVDALLKLMKVKENLNDVETVQKIQEIIKPVEHTKVDALVDIMFHATEDMQPDEPAGSGVLNEDEDEDDGEAGTANFHEECIERISRKLGTPLVKQGRTVFTSPDDTYRVLCVVSKKYVQKNSTVYWYAFHPYQQTFLGETAESYVAFGCGSADQIILMPAKKFIPLLAHMGKTELENKYYWHVKIFKKESVFNMISPRPEKAVDVTEYLLS